MKKNTILLLIMWTYTCISVGQISEPCYFDTYKEARSKEISLAEQKIRKALNEQSVKKNNVQAQSSNVKVIPVVVHVIHTGGTENISDLQIQSQIDVLNEDFRKIAGTNGDGNGVDTEVEFCLAEKDPQGRCTNGIVRVNSSLANHMTYQRSQLKQLSYWDNTRYLNMYVVKSINGASGILGYSSFPGGPPDEDGIVVRHNYFGTIGTAAGKLGRTTTHEIGHWFGLYHTFNGGCGMDTCADGDYVCDTPPAANPNYGCPTGVNSCYIDNPNVPDQIENYLDYSDDNCKSMFTTGQKNRMHATLSSLRFDIWQQWNIDSTGCDSGFVNGPCNVIADFVTLNPNICTGNSITFYNKSQNNPLTYQWYFNGGTPSTSTVLNPSVSYSTAGTYAVKLVVTNSQGIDSLTINNYIIVSVPPIGQALPFSEDFESAIFPNNGITVDNPDAGITWVRDTIALPYGGIASAKINNLINTNYGQSDALVLPSFDFTTFTGTPYLSFKWAYAKSDPNYSDELIVLVSKDCGVTWTQVFYRTGTNLVTGPTQTTPYIPDSSTVWKSANINLNTYATYQNVIIKIVNVTDGGNNLYIDNINLGSSIVTDIEELEAESLFTIYPNPAKEKITLSLNSEKNTTADLKIMDITGKILLLNNLNLAVGDNSVSVLLPTGINEGVYFLKVVMNNHILVRKFIITNR